MASPAPPALRITVVEQGDNVAERPAWSLSGWGAASLGVVLGLAYAPEIAQPVVNSGTPY